MLEIIPGVSFLPPSLRSFSNRMIAVSFNSILISGWVIALHITACVKQVFIDNNLDGPDPYAGQK